MYASRWNRLGFQRKAAGALGREAFRVFASLHLCVSVPGLPGARALAKPADKAGRDSRSLPRAPLGTGCLPVE
jgi:hypothetical protein